MNIRPLLLLLSLVATVCSACGSDDAPVEPLVASTIEPGSGVTIAGSPLSLGDSYVTVTERFGPPEVMHDLGAVGRRFVYAEHAISGLLQGEGDSAAVTRLTLHPGFDGLSASGVGIESEVAAVEAAYGAPLRETFVGSYQYRQLGLTFDVADDAVSRVHLYEAGR